MNKDIVITQQEIEKAFEEWIKLNDPYADELKIVFFEAGVKWALNKIKERDKK